MKDILPELNNKSYIEELNKDYEVRFCKVDECDKLIDFLRLYWKENHIFVLSRELFNWQHFDKVNNRYNFVVAKHKLTGEFHSILGFVPTMQFDSSIKQLEVWPCIWKSRHDINVKGLGVALYYYLKSSLPIETISILGISEIALSIYKHWNFETGKISHYYMLNKNISNYKLVSNYETALKMPDIKQSDSEKIICECSLEQYNELPNELFFDLCKYKSKKYYINRFYMHPIYKYKFFLIKQQEKVQAILVTRVCGALNKKCLRIVDFIGNTASLCGCSEELQYLMEKLECEYIDFVEVGISDNNLKNAGFVNKKDSNIIIPNYFEPFCLENVDLDYAFKTVVDDAEAIFYKADADQDRPNILN